MCQLVGKNIILYGALEGGKCWVIDGGEEGRFPPSPQLGVYPLVDGHTASPSGP